MRRLSLLVAVPVALTLLTSSVSGAATIPPHGRGAHTRAAMYANVLDHPGHRAFQLLDQLCARPQSQRGCVPVREKLRDKIKAVVRQPFVWVDSRQRHAGTLWVVSPVRFKKQRAKFLYAWSKAGPSACVGSGSQRFRLIKDAWVAKSGQGSVGCP